VVQNNTLTKANFTGVTTFDPITGKPNGTFYGVYDQNLQAG